METPEYQYGPNNWPIPKYQPKAPLGAGGFAEVWEAVSDQGDIVALKIFRTADLASQVLREAKTAVAMLSHSNLVSVREYHPGGSGQPPFIAMEMVPGRNLEVLIRNGELTGKKSGNLAKQILSALDHIHNHGLIHGDLKPSNILVTTSDLAKVCDYGYGIQSDTEEDRKLQHSMLAESIQADSSAADRFAVTAAYMAPEVRHGGTPTPVSDLFAFGLVLYEMLSGNIRPAFRSALTEREVEDAARWQTIINRCTALNPGDRYDDASSCLDDVNELLGGLSAALASTGDPSVDVLRGTFIDLLDKGLDIPDDLWYAAANEARQSDFSTPDLTKLVKLAGAEAARPGYGLILSAFLSVLEPRIQPIEFGLVHLRRPIDYLGAYNPGQHIRAEGPVESLGHEMKKGSIQVEGKVRHVGTNLHGGMLHIKGPVERVGDGMQGGEVVIFGRVTTIGTHMRGGKISICGDVTEIIGIEGGTIEVTGRVDYIDPDSKRYVKHIRDGESGFVEFVKSLFR